MKMNQFGLSETKLFRSHGIFKKNEIKSATRTPHPCAYEPPFQKSWIRPCNLQHSICKQVFSIRAQNSVDPDKITLSDYYSVFKTRINPGSAG